MHQFLKFIFLIKHYMFRTVPLSIIRSFSLHTQQLYMSHSLRASRIRTEPSSVLILLARKLSANLLCHIPLLCVQ